MAEAEPKQTQSPETPDQSQPPVVLEFDPAMNPGKRAEALERRIRSDAGAHGVEDLKGLSLEVTDDKGAFSRYEITDASENPVYEPLKQTKRFSRPRIEGPLFRKPDNAQRAKEGRRLRVVPELNRGAFKRLEIESEYRNVGLPRLAKHGKSWNVVRPRERVAPVYKKFVTVATYNGSNELVGTETIPVSEFFETVGGALTSKDNNGAQPPRASWNWEGPQAGLSVVAAEQAGRKDLTIGLTGHGHKVYEDVAEQLERHGITNWQGLTWQLEVPGGKPTAGSDSSKRGVGVETRTQEILEDSRVIEPDFRGHEKKYVRRFIVRTTEHYRDGTTVTVPDMSFRDYELLHYLDKPSDFPEVFGQDEAFPKIAKKAIIWNVRMPGALAPTEEQEREAREAQAHRITDGLEHGDDQRRPVYWEALGEIVLGRHADLEEPENEQAFDKLYRAKSDGERARDEELSKELQAVLSEEGDQYFDNAVERVHAAIHDEFEATMQRLGFPIKGMEEDHLWIAKALLGRTMKVREDHREAGQQLEHPFVHVLESPTILRDLIDEHVGIAFGQASIKKEEEVTGQKFDEEKGKMVPVIEEKIVFNEDLFEKFPLLPPENGVGSYSASGRERKWYDQVWGKINKKTHDIHKLLAADQPVGFEDSQELGRLLRRTIRE